MLAMSDHDEPRAEDGGPANTPFSDSSAPSSPKQVRRKKSRRVPSLMHKRNLLSLKSRKLLTLGAHAQRGLRSVSPSVCLSVTTFSATTRNKAAMLDQVEYTKSDTNGFSATLKKWRFS